MATITHGDVPTSSSLPYAGRVRSVASDQPFYWLAAGWRDFVAAPAASLGYGFLFVVIGFVLTYGLWRTDKSSCCCRSPQASCCWFRCYRSVFTPSAATSNKTGGHRFSGALFAWQGNAKSMVNAALAFMFLFLLWMRLSEIVFALTFPPTAALDVQGLLNATFFTVGGWEFLALFGLLGACMAALAFMGGAFALPMLLDKDVSMAEAIATSFTASLINIRTMAVWAALVADTACGGNGVLLCRPRDHAAARRTRKLARL